MSAVRAMVLAALLAPGCGGKGHEVSRAAPAPITGPSVPPRPTPTRPPVLEPLPADATLWAGDPLAGVDPRQITSKDGVLKRASEPDGEETAAWFPFAMDYWAIRRTDLEVLLAPHVGRNVRVTGHFTQTYDDGTWSYAVEPVKIVALAAGTTPSP